MTDDRKQPGTLSDLALERVMRDVFSGIWSPRLRETANGQDEAAAREAPPNDEAVHGGS